MSARRITCVLGVAIVACSEPAPPAEPPAPIELVALRASTTQLDGELDEPEWTSTTRTARFVDAIEGTSTTPYTEARAVYDETALVLALYAADEDVRTTDRMGAVLHAPNGATYVVEVSPTGEVRWHAPSSAATTPPEGVSAAIDADATLDVDDLEDEEWIAEIRVPWRALGMDGPGDVRANFFRRDQPRGQLVRSLAWSAWGQHPTAAVETLGLIRCGERT